MPPANRMYRHHPAPALANPFNGKGPRAVGLPWRGGAFEGTLAAPTTPKPAGR